jgi:lactate racemase
MMIHEFKYGRGHIAFGLPNGHFDVLDAAGDPQVMDDRAIGLSFDDPVAGPALDAAVRPGESVLIVVPDATRQTASGLIVNLLVRRLISNGIAPYDIRIIIATGIHRTATEQEKQQIVTPFIAQRIKILDHGPRDLMRLMRVGETSGGIAVEVDRSLVEHDNVILVGGISFHYFAGFTGGRKLICPGLASNRTIAATHKLAFDPQIMTRRVGVGPGLLDGNAVNEAFEEAALMVKVAFSINAIVNSDGDPIDIVCGEMTASHREACRRYTATNQLTINEKRSVVIAGCGGSPYDVNLIQAHKSLDAAAMACVDGGTIVLLAECAEGLGRDDMLDWLRLDVDAIARRLCEKYQVNGQTAWALKQKTSTYDVRMVTDLDEQVLDAAGIKPIRPDEIAGLNGNGGYIIPAASKFIVKAV